MKIKNLLLFCFIVTLMSAENSFSITLKEGQTLCLKNPFPAPASFNFMTIWWRITNWTPIKPIVPDSLHLVFDLYDSNWNLIFHWDDQSMFNNLNSPFFVRSDFSMPFNNTDLTSFLGNYAYFVFTSKAGTFEFDSSSLAFEFYNFDSQKAQIIPSTSTITTGQTLTLKNPLPALDSISEMDVFWTIKNFSPIDSNDLSLDFNLLNHNQNLVWHGNLSPLTMKPPLYFKSVFSMPFNNTDLTPFFGNYAYFVFTSNAGTFEFDTSSFVFFFRYLIARQNAQIVPAKPLSVKEMSTNKVSQSYTLFQNYPNPFNPSTNISFNLLAKSFVSLKVFNILGKEVATIVSEELSSGNYSRQWNAEHLSSGIYFYRLETGSFIETKKLVLLK